jgi:Ca2+-binding RTX toxin-like protein
VEFGLCGGEGNKTAIGGNWNGYDGFDYLEGGECADELFGGNGQDTFAVKT